MQFGFSIPNRGELANAQCIRAMAETGEKLGFDCIAVPDQVVTPRNYQSKYPYAEDGKLPGSGTGEALENFAVMAFLVGITQKLRLLSSVIVLPRRGAVVTAKALATIDVLSGGRLIVGCGAGWFREEFEALGAPPHDARGRVTDEYIAAFRELWTSDTPWYHGEFVRFENIIFEPKPIQQPGPPIWVGGEGAAAMRRVVALGDGWYPIGTNPRHPLDTGNRFENGVKRLNAISEQNGRDPSTISIAFWAHRYGLGDPIISDDGHRRLFSGSADDIKDDIAFMNDLGVTMIVFNFLAPGISQEEILDRMERYAVDVLAM
tara:strand:- start:329 stop:1285 length:957 start_codon:yes stop_codon:yes gene_type:complete